MRPRNGTPKNKSAVTPPTPPDAEEAAPEVRTPASDDFARRPYSTALIKPPGRSSPPGACPISNRRRPPGAGDGRLRNARRAADHDARRKAAWRRSEAGTIMSSVIVGLPDRSPPEHPGREGLARRRNEGACVRQVSSRSLRMTPRRWLSAVLAGVILALGLWRADGPPVDPAGGEHVRPRPPGPLERGGGIARGRRDGVGGEVPRPRARAIVSTGPARRRGDVEALQELDDRRGQPVSSRLEVARHRGGTRQGRRPDAPPLARIATILADRPPPLRHVSAILHLDHHILILLPTDRAATGRAVPGLRLHD